MRRAERVVHIQVDARRQLLGEFGIVLFFLGVVPQVLQQHDFTGRGAGNIGTDAVRRHRHFRARQQLSQPCGDGFQAHLGHHFALRTAEVARQDQRRAVFQSVFNRRESRLDALVRGDFQRAWRERHVEVHAHEDDFVLKVEIADR